MPAPCLALLIALHAASPAAAATRPLPAPSAVLGPDGPVRLGPLTDPSDPRGMAVVDPRSGALHLELPGVAGRFTWDGEAWWLDGTRLDGADVQRPDTAAAAPGGSGRNAAVQEGVRWEWGEAGLRAIVDPRGGRVRVTSDDRGAPARIEWPDGNRVEVSRDGFGRVVRVAGPGTGQLRYAWQDGGVLATDAAGRPWSIRPRQGVQRAASILEVSDALGRSSRTFLGDDGELLGWADPRGLETWLQRRGDLLELVDGLGRTWRVHTSSAGRVHAIDVPGAGRWTWRLGHLDQLLNIEDPAGRIHTWSEDRPGRLATVGEGPSSWRLRRDPSGRVSAIVDPNGAITELQRDGAGRVVKIIDPLGNSTALQRDSAGEVVAVQGPDDARWTLSRDLFGRLAAVDAPTGDRVELRRDAAGELVSIVDSRRGRFELARGVDGRLSRIKAPAGEVLALERDGIGRLAVVRGAGERAVRIRRDVLGEPVELRVEEPGRGVGEDAAAVVTITRDAGGQPTAVGAVRWRRDGAGRVVGIDAPGRSVTLDYDPAGALRQARGGDWWIELSRDGAGRIVRWNGSDGEVSVRRDPAGRIVEELVTLPSPEHVGRSRPAAGQGDTGDGLVGSADTGASDLLGTWADALAEAGSLGVGSLDAGGGVATAQDVPDEGAAGAGLALSRDPAGRLDRVAFDGAQWRLLRGADGRLLRLEGPDGAGVGMDRDAAGRISLLRLPRGALARRAWLDAGEAVTFRGTDGRELDTRLLRWDALDRLAEVDDGPYGGQRWRRDPEGRLVLVEDRAGEAWSWTPGGMHGPGGVELVFDEQGRIATARPPVGPPAWWVGSSVLSYAWDETGPLAWVAGELGAVAVGLDALGRLSMVTEETGRVHRVRYDARGRLTETWRDTSREQRLVWAPGDPGQDSHLLVSGPDATDRWSWSDWGPAAVMVAGRVFELLLDPTGRAWWSIDGSGLPLRHSTRLRGYPELASATASADLVGPGGTLQLGAGGPLVVPRRSEGGAVPAGLALDPVSGQRIDGLRPWPWQPAGLLEGAAVDPLDPTPWQPTSPWDQPLDLLQALGELDAPVGGDFLVVDPAPPPLPALPGGLSDRDPPLGPPLSALPLSLDPLATVVLRSALPGGEPLDADVVVRTQLAEELALPWLPPGIAVPLPDAWLTSP